MIAGDGAGARVGPGRGGVVGRFGSPDSVAGPSSRASVARHPGKPGYSSGPGAGAAGTSVHTLSGGTAGSRDANDENRRVDPAATPRETGNGPREVLLPSGPAAGR